MLQTFKSNLMPRPQFVLKRFQPTFLSTFEAFQPTLLTSLLVLLNPLYLFQPQGLQFCLHFLVGSFDLLPQLFFLFMILLDPASLVGSHSLDSELLLPFLQQSISIFELTQSLSVVRLRSFSIIGRGDVFCVI